MKAIKLKSNIHKTTILSTLATENITVLSVEKLLVSYIPQL